MRKLCYIAPEYNKLTSEHYYHIYELLEDVAHQLDIFLVLEKSIGRPEIKGIGSTYTMKFALFPLNLMERLFVFIYIRLKGYRKFYIHYSYSSTIIAAIVTKILGGETLCWQCNLKKDFMVKWAPSFMVIKKKLTDDYAFLLTIKLTDHLVTGSEFMKDYYSANFGLPKEKIKVMPNWVNLERFDAKKYDREQLKREFHLNANQKIVLFIHWLSPRKGPQYLAKVAKEVSQRVPNVLFLIIGEGPYKRTLKWEIEENELQDTMRVIGAVPNREIPRYYAIADLFIMPSDKEGFPRVLAEAMAMGVPFVATDIGSVKEITTEKQQAYIVPRGDIVSFSEKMVKILEDNELREALKREGIKKVKDFSKEKVAKLFTQLFDSRGSSEDRKI